MYEVAKQMTPRLVRNGCPGRPAEFRARWRCPGVTAAGGFNQHKLFLGRETFVGDFEQ